MAQGEFTKEECDSVKEALKEIIKAMPKSKVGDFIGHFNDLFLFINTAKKAAPSEK